MPDFSGGVDVWWGAGICLKCWLGVDLMSDFWGGVEDWWGAGICLKCWLGFPASWVAEKLHCCGAGSLVGTFAAFNSGGVVGSLRVAHRAAYLLIAAPIKVFGSCFSVLG
ncbi:hypothetical protein U1Q18_002037 [Sarracenia purpurea var. burkii]